MESVARGMTGASVRAGRRRTESLPFLEEVQHQRAHLETEMGHVGLEQIEVKLGIL